MKSYGLWDAIWLAIAKLLPAHLVYAAFLRMFKHATSGEYGNEMPTNVTAITVMRRWNRDKLHRK